MESETKDTNWKKQWKLFQVHIRYKGRSRIYISEQVIVVKRRPHDFEGMAQPTSTTRDTVRHFHYLHSDSRASTCISRWRHIKEIGQQVGDDTSEHNRQKMYSWKLIPAFPGWDRCHPSSSGWLLFWQNWWEWYLDTF